MSITLNTIANSGTSGMWIVSAQSADVTGNEELKAAVTGKSHFIKKIAVDCCPGTTAKWFQINAGTTAIIGPIDQTDYASHFVYEFKDSIKVTSGAAINIDQETAAPIHVIMEGFTEI